MTDMLEAVQALREPIRKSADQMRLDRRVPLEIIDALREAGVFDMALPTSMGGPGLTPLEQFEIVEELTIADASVGWCVMIGADSGYYPAFLSDEAFADLYPTRNLVTAGKVAPAGKALPVDGGWRVTGRWDFGSGSTHADRFVGGVFLCDADGEMVIEDGRPRMAAAYLPRDEVVVHDTWDTVGLRATASNDYEVSDAFVPEHHLFNVFEPTVRDDPIHRWPALFIYKGAGIYTGLARRAIDEAVAAAEGKLLFPEMIPLIERPGTQETIARAEASARAARASVLADLAELWAHCVDGDVERAHAMPLRLSLVHASQVAADVARSMFDLLTTTSIRSDSVHAHLVADAAVANTHILSSHRSWVPLGAMLAGREVSGGFFL